MVIFTDLVIRAVDLELLEDMSSEELLSTYRRFLAHHAPSLYFVSDNAPQFHLLREIIAVDFRHDFTWKFLPAHSPWEGGVYERIIKIFKDSILRTFYNCALTDTALRTSLCEIVAMLNARPLTYVSEDGNDIPLMPNDFLKIHFTQPDDIIPPENATVTAEHLTHIWKQSQTVADNLSLIHI